MVYIGVIVLYIYIYGVFQFYIYFIILFQFYSYSQVIEVSLRNSYFKMNELNFTIL